MRPEEGHTVALESQCFRIKDGNISLILSPLSLRGGMLIRCIENKEHSVSAVFIDEYGLSVRRVTTGAKAFGVRYIVISEGGCESVPFPFK